MLDLDTAPIKASVQRSLESLFSLIGLEAQEAPLQPPTRTFVLPIASLDLSEVKASIAREVVRVNEGVNRAFDEVNELVKLLQPRPIRVAVRVSIQRHSYMYHIYATIELYHD